MLDFKKIVDSFHNFNDPFEVLMQPTLNVYQSPFTWEDGEYWHWSASSFLFQSLKVTGMILDVIGRQLLQLVIIPSLANFSRCRRKEETNTDHLPKTPRAPLVTFKQTKATQSTNQTQGMPRPIMRNRFWLVREFWKATIGHYKTAGVNMSTLAVLQRKC
jgi:hypothetical protein